MDRHRPRTIDAPALANALTYDTLDCLVSRVLHPQPGPSELSRAMPIPRPKCAARG